MKMMEKLFMLIVSVLLLASCQEEFGVNPYDPNTPITVSEWPNVYSFSPETGKAGDEITITGRNFTTATAVTFGSREAKSFTVVDDNTILAVLGPYGESGAVAVTNHKGERSKQGFVYDRPVLDTSSPNLGLEAMASSSAFQDGSPAGNICDGIEGTAWIAADNDASAERWVMLELAALSKVNAVRVLCKEDAPATDFVVKVSEDGVEFTEVAQVTGWTPSEKEKGAKKIKFSDVKAKYIRLEGIHNGLNDNNVCIYELSVYELTDPVNIAFSKPVEADCEPVVGEVKNITLALNLMMQFQEHTAHWVVIDLEKTMAFDNMVISMDAGAYAKNLKMSISDDGVSYNPVYENTNWTAGSSVPVPSLSGWNRVVLDAAFEECEARYVRVDMSAISSSYNLTVFGIEIYNQW